MCTVWLYISRISRSAPCFFVSVAPFHTLHKGLLVGGIFAVTRHTGSQILPFGHACWCTRHAVPTTCFSACSDSMSLWCCRLSPSTTTPI